MAVTIRPLEGYLVIRPIKKNQTLKGGIILPDQEGPERAEQGEVIAVGGPVWHEGGLVDPPKIAYIDKDGTHIESCVDPGDIVLFHPYGGREFEVDEVKYHLIPFYGDGRAMAVIEDTK